jgi:hypothetical protein
VLRPRIGARPAIVHMPESEMRRLTLAAAPAR